MNSKLFWSVTLAFVVGLPIAYIIIRWLWTSEKRASAVSNGPQRAIGFAAIRQQTEMEAESA